MKRYFAIAFQSLTADGYPIAAACICDKDKVSDSIKQMSRVSDFKCSYIEDSLYIDYRLAEFIKSISPSYIHGVGASISIPGVSESTGGVIGSPHKDIYSAKGDFEYISEDLILFSVSEGPGFIIQGDEQKARAVLNESQKISNMKVDSNSALNILDSIKKSNINIGIIVADGSGPGNKGCVIAYEYGRTIIIQIP